MTELGSFSELVKMLSNEFWSESICSGGVSHAELIAYADFVDVPESFDRPTPDETRRIEYIGSHFEGCERCRKIYDREKALTDMLSEYALKRTKQ